MLNGRAGRFDNFKVNLPTDFTNSENLTESYELQMFSLKEIHPDNSASSEELLSPHLKGTRMKGLWKLDENSANLSNVASRRVTDDAKSSVGTSITEFRLASMHSPEKFKYSEGFLGCSPCAVFCGCCKKYVQSLVEAPDETSFNYFKKITQAFAMCCGSNENLGILHRCPYCALVLGRVY
jgi:hypothetical protein